MAVEISDFSPHAVEVQPQPFGCFFGVIAEVQEDVIEEIGRILGPIQAQTVYFGIVLAEVSNKGLEIVLDMRAGKTSVMGQTSGG
mgnify:CR=1 FL=1